MNRRRFAQTLTSAAILGRTRILSAAEAPYWSRTEPRMGCDWTLTLPGIDPAKGPDASDFVFNEIARLNQVFSDYETTSELNRLCDAAGGTAPVPLSAELFDILQHSQTIAETSGGLFDITLAPCIRLWRRSRRRGELPDKESLEKARSLSGWKNLELDPGKRTAWLKVRGMQLDLGGIAKGWTQDHCLKILRDRYQISCVLLDAAGEVAVGTPPPGRGAWHVGIQTNARQPSRRIAVKETNVATSGDHWQFVEIGGVRYSHIIDPETGLGSTISRQGTVIAATGVVADPLAKILVLTNPEKSLAFFKQHYPSVQASVSISRQDHPASVHQTEGFPPDMDAVDAPAK